MKKILLIISLFCFQIHAQETYTVLGFEEYMGYVKRFHPLVRQAQIALTEGEVNLLKARGAFDPKLEVDFNQKTFQSTDYYNTMAATFKIPTWYGIELKAQFEEASGYYLNPQNTVPDDGLYTAGVSVSLAQGLLINDRMAALKQAKFYAQQRKAERDLLVNQVLYQAALTYFDWLKAFREYQVNDEFLENAQIRFLAIKASVDKGDKAAIDSVEAAITINTRKLSVEKSQLKLNKASLKLSNFLWLDSNLPLELKNSVVPDVYTLDRVNQVLGLDQVLDTNSLLQEHPKMLALGFKYKQLEVDKKLKLNKLLPVFNLEYNFLSQQTAPNTFNTSDYKSGVYFKMPLFLRKERGDFNLAKLKLQDMTYEIASTRLTLSNKIKAMQQELSSLERQQLLVKNVVNSYDQMLKAEERKLELGDSSLFLINSRENSLMDAQLKAVDLEFQFLEAKANMFNNLALSPLEVQ